jgi:FAD:protein FMN transferase
MNYKKLAVQVSILALFIGTALVLTYINKRGEYVYIDGFAQGSTYRITYESRSGENLKPQIDSLLADFDLSLSIYNPKSLVSRINKDEAGVKADEHFTRAFEKSFEVYKKTEGAFDITVGPLVDAFGFGSTDTLKVDSVMIRNLLKLVGMNKVKLEQGTVIKENKDMLLDFNAIAQGYSVDLVSDFLKERKIRNFMVEIGGEVRAQGKNEKNQVWHIGIDKPIEGNTVPGTNLQAIVSLDNKSLATSGNYRKFYERNGVKFVHTVNPKTGYPAISNLLSASVVAKDCITADAYATALMVFGKDKSIAFLKQNRFLEAYLIYADQQGKFQIYVTPGLKKYIEEE